MDRLPDDSCNVVVEGHDECRRNQEQARDCRTILKADRWRTPLDLLVDKVEEEAPVDYGEREEVDDRQVDGDQAEKEQQVGESAVSNLGSEMDDPKWTMELLDSNRSPEESVDGQVGQYDQFARFLEAHANGVQWIAFGTADDVQGLEVVEGDRG